MQTRHYQTAYTIAKAMEVLSWILLGGGVIAGALIIGSGNTGLGIGVILSAFVFGPMLVFYAQLTLMFVDIGNNTFRMVDENTRTNAMLAETLGIIAVNVTKIAQKEQ